MHRKLISISLLLPAALILASCAGPRTNAGGHVPKCGTDTTPPCPLIGPQEAGGHVPKCGTDLTPPCP